MIYPSSLSRSQKTKNQSVQISSQISENSGSRKGMLHGFRDLAWQEGVSFVFLNKSIEPTERVFSLMFPETEGYGLEDSAKSTMTQISTFVIIGECCHARRILAGSGDTGTAPPVLWQSRRQTNVPRAAMPRLYACGTVYCQAERDKSPNISLYAPCCS